MRASSFCRMGNSNPDYLRMPTHEVSLQRRGVKNVCERYKLDRVVEWFILG